MEFISLLPDHIYHGEPHVKDLQNAFSSQFQKALDDYESLLKQVRPSTAGPEGLRRFEAEYDIAQDPEKPPEQRLAIWRAKRRGQGTVTIRLIQNVAESFSNGKVSVTEFPNEYRIAITFVGTIGIPPNIPDFERAVREILPAHLAYQLVYIYNRHSSLRKLSHKQLSQFTQWQIRNKLLMD